MTVTTQSSKITYQGNGATTAFSFTFEIPTSTDAFVYYTDASGVQTLLNSALYTITGIGDAAGGTVTYPLTGSPIASGTKLTIQRVMPLTQEVDLVNQDGFYPEVVEGGLDTLEFQIQQMQEQISRSLTIPVGDINAVVTIPTQAARAGFLLGFDSNGNPTAVSTLPTNIVSAAMIPVVEAATLAIARSLLGFTGDLTVNSLVFTGAGPSQIVSPTGNPGTTLAELSVQGAAQGGEREFLVNLGMTSHLGGGDKVVLYGGIVGSSGTGDIWAFNTVTTMAAASGAYNAQGYELDFNNLNANRGEALAGAGLSAPVAYGLAITGAGSFRSTSALLISGPGAAIWNRGITFVNSSVKQASIQDLGSADISYEIQGSHVYGLDMALAVFSGAAIRMPNNSEITWINAAENANLGGMNVDASGNMFVGSNFAAGVFIGSGSGTVVVGNSATNTIIGPSSNVKIGGSLTDAITPIDISTGTDQHLCVTGHNSLADGVQILSKADNATLKGLEIVGDTLLLNWSTALQLGAPGFAAGVKAQARYFPVKIGASIVNILTD